MRVGLQAFLRSGLPPDEEPPPPTPVPVPPGNYNFTAGSLPAGIAFTRSSAAWGINSLGVLTQHPIDTPRLVYDPATMAPLGLLLENVRTNSLRNNTMVGAVAGTPGTQPTNWAGSFSTASAVTRTIGVGTEDGIEYIDLNYVGTPSATGPRTIFPEATTVIPAVTGQIWTSSAYLKLVAGSMTNASLTMFVVEHDGAGAQLTFSQVIASAITTAPLRTQRYAVVRTLASGTTAFVTLQIHFACTINLPVDITFRIGLPQLEMAEFTGGTQTSLFYASSPIKTSTVAVSRAQDLATITDPSALTDKCVIINGRAPLTFPSGVTQPLYQVDVGTNASRKVTSRNSGSVISSDTTGGVISVVSGVVAGNTDFKLAVRYDDNNSAASLNGGAVVEDNVGAVPTGFTTARIGANAPTSHSWFSTIKSVETRPTASNAELVALSVLPVAQDDDASAWAAAVVASGGSVSAGRLAIATTFIIAEKVSGAWYLTDDYWPLWGENAVQALTSLKRRRLATAVNAPVHSVDRGYVFNGTTQYLNTGFVPSTHAVAMTGTNLRIAIYERTDLAGGHSAGATNDLTTQNLMLLARGVTFIPSYLNSGQNNVTLTPQTSVGFGAVSRSDGVTARGYKNGVALTPVAVITPGTALPTFAVYIGARNGSGTAQNHRASSVSFMCLGSSLSAAQELAQYNNVQAWAASIGAAIDPDVAAWAAQVVTNGGTVSAARQAVVDQFIVAEKAAGTWALTDDYWPLWGENAAQSLTSLKQRRLATAVAAPVHTPDRGYAFDGSTQYINTNMTTASHAVAMTASNQRIAVYERTNVDNNLGAAAGTTNTATSLMWIFPRGTNNRLWFRVNANGNCAFDLPSLDSRGYSAVSINGTTFADYRGYKNGAALTIVPTAPTVGSGLCTAPLFIGATNSSGAVFFRASSIGLMAVGALLSPAQEAAQYANIQAWATTIGAQV